MKKILPFLVISVIILIAPLIASAQGITLENPLKYDDIGQIIEAIANLVATISSTIAIIMIIWAGIVYMTAGDNEDRTKSAKKTIQWALIGIAIVWSAKFLINLIEGVLGKK